MCLFLNSHPPREASIQGIKLADHAQVCKGITSLWDTTLRAPKFALVPWNMPTGHQWYAR